jgi:hypothetical protein
VRCASKCFDIHTLSDAIEIVTCTSVSVSIANAS